MTMLIGLVGAPNAGKSSFFKALTQKQVEIADYPFTTITANQGVGHVLADCPCTTLKLTCDPQNSSCMDGTRLIPVRLLDVAGLVPGAHEGKGLGNQFLDDLRQGDALIHVLDSSGATTSEGKPGEWDPLDTVKMLEEEIDSWIGSIVGKNREKLERTAAAEKIPMVKLLTKQLSGLGVTEQAVASALRAGSPETREFITAVRKESKPILIAANKIDLPTSKEHLTALRKEYVVVPCSAESELALQEAAKHNLITYTPGNGFQVKGTLSDKQQAGLDLIEQQVIKPYGSTGVYTALNAAVFELLDMVAVYPVASISKRADKKGNILPDVHLVKKGTPLKEFAAKVHKDLADRFIGGINLQGRKIGADYPLQSGDVVEILFKK